MFVRASMYEFAWRCGKGEEGGGLAILCSSPRSKFGIPFESDPHPSIVSDGDESLNDRFRRWLRIAGPLDCDQLRHASMRKRARNERKRGCVPFRVSPSAFVPSGIIDASLLARIRPRKISIVFERNFQRNSRDKNSFDLFLHASRRLTRLILSVSSFNLLASEKVNSWRVFRGKFRR